MVRDIVLVAAIGFGVFGDTYTIANTLPNIVYILIAGGALNAVFIPQLVRRMTEDTDDGAGFADRLITLVIVLLIAVAAVAVLVAPAIIALYGPSTWTAADSGNAVLFARFCLPQVIFYGMFAVFSQVLNARGSFIAPMYAPIASNIVVIASAVGFLAVAGTRDPQSATVPTSAIVLLGLGTTLGIAVQALVLLPVMARAGYRWRPRTSFRGYGLRRSGGLAGWTFLFVLTNQLALIVVTRLAAAANVVASQDPGLQSVGYTSYTRAYLLFVLPHSVITVSIVTFLLPRMSRAASDGDDAAVSRDVGQGALLAGSVLLPMAVVLFVTGPRVAELLFGYGAATSAQAALVGTVLQAFLVGLLPFTVFYVVLRGFYAYEDTRTPALVNLVMTAGYVVIALALYAAVPAQWKVPALALAYGLSYAMGTPVAWRLLSRRTHGLPSARVAQGFARMTLACVGCALAAVVVVVGLGPVLGQSRAADAVVVLFAALLGSGAYYLIARRLHIHEVDDVVRQLAGRLVRK